MAVIVREKVEGSGVWWVFINHKGRRRSKKIGAKSAANKVAREVEARLAKGDMGLVKEKCPTIGSYGRKWLDSSLREQTDSTMNQYNDSFRLYIKPYFGNKRLDEVKRRHVKAFIGMLKDKGLSPSSSKLILAVLSNIFENAIEDEILTVNPCQKTRKHCGNGSTIEINPLDRIETQEMLEGAATLPCAAHGAYLLAVRTGLRLGELLAVEWTDLDLEARTLEVSKSYNYRLERTSSTKNRQTRTVDLTPACVEALRKLRSQRKVASISGLVFTDEKGERLKHYYLERTVKKIAPRPIRFHDLRHTYATLRLGKGDNVIDVSRQLGHSKISMTVDTYGHWIPSQHKSQVDELDDLHLSCTLSAPANRKP